MHAVACSYLFEFCGRAVDLAQLTRSLVRLSEENDVLKARNAQLETEVRRSCPHMST